MGQQRRCPGKRNERTPAAASSSSEKRLIGFSLVPIAALLAHSSDSGAMATGLGKNEAFKQAQSAAQTMINFSRMSYHVPLQQYLYITCFTSYCAQELKHSHADF